MIFQHQPPLHLTYCLNIHPGETWAEQRAAIAEKAALVAKLVQHENWFGLGLRLGAQSVEDLADDPITRRATIDLFDEHQLYPFSINASLDGRFHGGPAKEKAYSPDWRMTERRNYTFDVCDILAEWLPEGVDGSINTLPCSFKQWILEPSAVSAMAENIASIAAYLAALRDDTGKEIHLGLEPEPDCYLGTTAETVTFFKEALWTAGVLELRRIRQCYTGEAEAIMRRHVGVCLDTAHVAMQFESPLEALRTYRDEGIRISKVQLGAALQAPANEDGWEALRPFTGGTHLHQTKARAANGEIRSWTDLPLALADSAGRGGMEEVRTHFRVPLFWNGHGPLVSTAHTLTPDFFQALRLGATSHVEIESYDFDSLPPEIHPGDVVKSVAREFAWVRERL